jgi:hypothetical protein
MEENKYYTPDLTELHFGQEIEVFNNPHKCYFEHGNDNEWLENKINYGLLGDMANVMRLLMDKQIRVKYLDKSDIESLGFMESSTKGFFEKPNGRFYIIFDYWLTDKDYEFMKVRIDDEESEFSFSGMLKNKSELINQLKRCKAL